MQLLTSRRRKFVGFWQTTRFSSPPWRSGSFFHSARPFFWTSPLELAALAGSVRPRFAKFDLARLKDRSRERFARALELPYINGPPSPLPLPFPLHNHNFLHYELQLIASNTTSGFGHELRLNASTTTSLQPSFSKQPKKVRFSPPSLTVLR